MATQGPAQHKRNRRGTIVVESSLTSACLWVNLGQINHQVVKPVSPKHSRDQFLPVKQGSIKKSPSCCPRCLADRALKAFIGRKGVASTECDFCGAGSVRTVNVSTLLPKLAHLFAGYTTPVAGVHYIPELGDADGEPLDYLLDEDNPGLFASTLSPNQRQKLVQAFLNELDEDLDMGFSARDANDLWVRPGSEIWAGADDEWSLADRPDRWSQFVWEISHRSRYFRIEKLLDPATYLTADVLKRLTRRLPKATPLYRAVLGGTRTSAGLVAHSAQRMGGPELEHSKEGLRVNAPGVPLLYAAKDTRTCIAEVRPWVGAPVSVATLRLQTNVRLVDFSPKRRHGRKNVLPKTKANTHEELISERELKAILETIGQEMARPVDPAESQVRYAATQYVSEIVKNAGYDGVMFKSAVGPGTNIVLLKKNDARVETVQLYEVNRVQYTAAPNASSSPSGGPSSWEDDSVDFPF